MQHYKLTLYRKRWVFEGSYYGIWLFRGTNEQDAVKRLKNAVEYSGRHRSPFYVSEKLNEINRSIQKGHLETIDAKEWWGCYHHSEWEKVTRDVISRF